MTSLTSFNVDFFFFLLFVFALSFFLLQKLLAIRKRFGLRDLVPGFFFVLSFVTIHVELPNRPSFLFVFLLIFFFISTGSAFFLFSHYVIYFLRSLSVSEDIYSCKYRNWGTWQRGGEIKSGLVFLSHPSPS